MNPLRHLPTRRLLSILAAVVVLGGSVTAVAVAALTGSGPIPAAKTLAAAIHDAITGEKIAGVTAEIQFTNHLVDTSSFPGAGPLLSGATGRLWADDSGHLRLELQASSGDTEITVGTGLLPDVQRRQQHGLPGEPSDVRPTRRRPAASRTTSRRRSSRSPTSSTS